MKKYLLVKNSKRHSVDEITIEKESQPIQTKVGVINLNGRQLGNKKNKPKFKNNPNKVFMKRKK
jgi:hypothetical protein